MERMQDKLKLQRKKICRIVRFTQMAPKTNNVTAGRSHLHKLTAAMAIIS